MNLAEYLALLGMTDSDHVGILWKKSNHLQTAVVTAEMVPVWLEHQTPADHDIYIAPNPVRGPVRINSGRGTEADVTCVRTLYADLDVKAGACQDKNAAALLIDDVAAILHERPIAIIHSGGGLQPIWAIEDTDPTEGRKLLHRFGRLMRVIAQARNIQVDSVFDTARILRAPGTLNHKYDPPIEASVIEDTGAPMDPATVSERLDEAGI